MKKIISILLLCTTILLGIPVLSFAGSTPAKTITMKKRNHRGDDLPQDHWGQRAPSAPVVCTISQDGISIAGMDNPQIFVYEAYDTDGACIISCSSEAEFISLIYQIQDEIELRLYTDDCVFSGWWLL